MGTAWKVEADRATCGARTPRLGTRSVHGTTRRGPERLCPLPTRTDQTRGRSSGVGRWAQDADASTTSRSGRPVSARRCSPPAWPELRSTPATAPAAPRPLRSSGHHPALPRELDRDDHQPRRRILVGVDGLAVDRRSVVLHRPRRLTITHPGPWMTVTSIASMSKAGVRDGTDSDGDQGTAERRRRATAGGGHARCQSLAPSVASSMSSGCG